MQTQLGPKSIVNPFTGDFPQDHPAPDGYDTGGRLQVHTADLDPGQNPGALYFLEGQHVAADDAAAGNWANNVSYRQVWVTGAYDLTFANPTGGTSVTAQMVPAIQAWQDQDPSVFVNTADVPNDGRIYVARKATPLGGGQWHYELAIQNVNSDRAIGGVLVLLPTGASASNLGFHNVDYHSGEVYSGTDWTQTGTLAGPRWNTEDYAANPNANALRWGTLYNFWFNANVSPPNATLIQLRLFKPGATTALERPHRTASRPGRRPELRRHGQLLRHQPLRTLPLQHLVLAGRVSRLPGRERGHQRRRYVRTGLLRRHQSVRRPAQRRWLSPLTEVVPWRRGHNIGRN